VCNAITISRPHSRRADCSIPLLQRVDTNNHLLLMDLCKSTVNYWCHLPRNNAQRCQPLIYAVVYLFWWGDWKWKLREIGPEKMRPATDVRRACSRVVRCKGCGNMINRQPNSDTAVCPVAEKRRKTTCHEGHLLLFFIYTALLSVCALIYFLKWLNERFSGQ
jgi:hypothetical protein